MRITASELQITEYSGRKRRDFAWKRQDITSIGCGRAPGQWTSSLQICSRQGELASLLEGHDEDYLNWLIGAIKHGMLVLRSTALGPPPAPAAQPTETPPFDLITPDMGRGHRGLYVLGAMTLVYVGWLLAFGWRWSMEYKQAGMIQVIEVTILGILLWALYGNLDARVRRHRVMVAHGVLVYSFRTLFGSRELRWQAYALSDLCATARQRPQDGLAFWHLDIQPVGAAPIRIPTCYSEEELQSIVGRLRGALGMPG